jgi:hypothetical protein
MSHCWMVRLVANEELLMFTRNWIGMAFLHLETQRLFREYYSLNCKSKIIICGYNANSSL